MRSSAEGFRMVKELCSNIQDLYKMAKKSTDKFNTPWAPSGPERIAPRIPPAQGVLFGCATLCAKWPELRAIGYLKFAYKRCASLR